MLVCVQVRCGYRNEKTKKAYLDEQSAEAAQQVSIKLDAFRQQAMIQARAY